MTDAVEAARSAMVEQQIAGRGIFDPRILEAFRAVPREAFVPAHLQHCAYDDNPLPIGRGQTISQPYIVALMAEAAQISPQSRILEIGTGSGYAAAIYARLAAQVVTVERHHDLARGASLVLARLGYANVEVVTADGSLGAPDRAPYDAILVAAAVPALPEPLKRQLAQGGRMVIPVSVDGHEELQVITRTADSFAVVNLGSVRFVPLVGAEGWTET